MARPLQEAQSSVLESQVLCLAGNQASHAALTRWCPGEGVVAEVGLEVTPTKHSSSDQPVPGGVEADFRARGNKPTGRQKSRRGPAAWGGPGLPLRGWHVRLAERNGQLQVLLFLPLQPCQPLLLRLLALPLGPHQLLLLIAKLERQTDPRLRDPQQLPKAHPHAVSWDGC